MSYKYTTRTKLLILKSLFAAAAFTIAVAGCSAEETVDGVEEHDSQQSEDSSQAGEDTSADAPFPQRIRPGSIEDCSEEELQAAQEDQEPLTVNEWVHHSDGVAYGEVIAVEPILDRFVRQDLDSTLAEDGECLDDSWETHIYADLIIEPIVEAGHVGDADTVRIRINRRMQVTWSSPMEYSDGALRSQDGAFIIEPGSFIGARLHDLGMDGDEPTYSPLSTSLFSFDSDGHMQLQYRRAMDDEAAPDRCGAWTESDFTREVDAIRPGLSIDEFEQLLASLSLEDFSHPVLSFEERARASALPGWLISLDPDKRASDSGAMNTYLYLTSSLCNPKGWAPGPQGDGGDGVDDRD